jgi:hypothetical protein
MNDILRSSTYLPMVVNDHDTVYAMLQVSKGVYNTIFHLLYKRVVQRLSSRLNMSTDAVEYELKIPDGFVGWCALSRLLYSGDYTVPYWGLSHNNMGVVEFIPVNAHFRTFSRWKDDSTRINVFCDKMVKDTDNDTIPMLTLMLKYLGDTVGFIPTKVIPLYNRVIRDISHRGIREFLSLPCMGRMITYADNNLFREVSDIGCDNIDIVVSLATKIISIHPDKEKKVKDNLESTFKYKDFLPILLHRIPFQYVSTDIYTNKDHRLSVLRSIKNGMSGRDLFFLERYLGDEMELSDEEYEMMLELSFKEYTEYVPTPMLKTILETLFIIHTYENIQLMSDILLRLIRSDIYIPMIKLLQTTSNFHPTDEMYEIATNTSDTMLMVLLGE